MSTIMAYLGVIFTAAVPWFELFAIPPAIALGLSPVLVGLLAGVSNALVTVAIVLGWERLSAWLQRRRGQPLTFGAQRSERGRRAFERFGVPGLALQGPVLSGIYFAAVLALGLGASRKSVIVWSVVSIALWTTALAILTIAGVTFL